jgi:hypothetical protein
MNGRPAMEKAIFRPKNGLLRQAGSKAAMVPKFIYAKFISLGNFESVESSHAGYGIVLRRFVNLDH